MISKYKETGNILETMKSFQRQFRNQTGQTNDNGEMLRGGGGIAHFNLASRGAAGGKPRKCDR